MKEVFSQFMVKNIKLMMRREGKDEIVLGFMLVAMPASFHHFDLDFSKRKHEKMRQLEGKYTNLA